ncbi:MAG: PP2C family protein-serine/threonine phosphatase [Burkholderiales bacterium]
MQVELALLSEVGGRNYNEDACGHWHSERYLCCVLADGAGGHGGGDAASRIAVSHILSRYAAAPTHSSNAMRELMLDTNRELIARRSERPEWQNMQTTVVMVSVDLQARTALWAHGGDSRLYLLRNGALWARTLDHSLVQSLVNAGIITAEAALTHPRRSELYSAMASSPEDLHVEVLQEPWPLAEGDSLLLCTDGLWEWANEDVMLDEREQASNAKDWLERLGSQVRRATTHKPNHDNYSAVALWF